MANISWSISIQVAGGPTVTAREGPISIEATDRIEVHVPGSASNPGKITVDLQPGPASRIHFLLIKSSQYGSGTNITYEVSDGITDGSTINLSGPQFYSGGAGFYSGSTSALSGLDPKLLKFSNASADPAQIEIFIARDATPEPVSGS